MAAERTDELEIKRCIECGLTVSSNERVCPKDGSILMETGKDPLLGETVAERFQVMSVLGRGGMSVVYKARHLFINRLVALKMLKQQGCDPVDLKRFQQEAMAASSLGHPNIVTVYDFGIDNQGRAFIVLDYLAGNSLADLIGRRCFTIEQCIEIFLQCCDALGHVHRKGIVHRDLKPSNIMLVNGEDGKESVKIVDFGIARLLPQDGNKVETLTRTGELFGSPYYMSPEHISGGQVDTRSDIYSFGCVMYEVLSGQPPLAGETTFDTLMRHLADQPEPLKSVGPHMEIPASLESIVFKCLEKQPRDRYQSMVEVAEALREMVAQPGRRPWRHSFESLGRWLKRRRRLLFNPLTGVCCAVLLLVSTGFLAYKELSTQFRLSVMEPRGLTEWARQDDQGRRELLAGNLDLAEQSFIGAVQEAERDGSFAAQMDSLDYLSKTKKARGKIGEAAMVRSQLSSLRKQRRLALELDEEQAVSKIESLKRDMVSALAHTGKEACLKTARELVLAGQWATAHQKPQIAERLFTDALKLQRKSAGANSVLATQTELMLAEVLVQQGKVKEASEIIESSIAALSRQLGPGSAKLIPFLLAKYKIAESLGDWPQARAVKRQSLTIALATCLPDDPVFAELRKSGKEPAE